jgi:hypothetical protein
LKKLIPSGAKQAAEKLGISGEIGEEHPSGAKARLDSIAFTARLKPRPFKHGGLLTMKKRVQNRQVNTPRCR